MLYTMVKVLAFFKLIDFYSRTDQISILCPFHQEKNPSCSVNTKIGKGFCFRCHTSWKTVDEFIYHYKNIVLNEKTTHFQSMVLRRKIDQMEFDLPEIGRINPFEGLDDITSRKLSARYFCSLPVVEWKDFPGSYLIQERNFRASVLNEFDVRVNRNSLYNLVFPVYEQGKFRGYISRKSEGKSEYLFSDGMRKSLCLAGNLEQEPIMLVEGFLDKMKAWQWGFYNVACLFGWYISEAQIKKIRKIFEKTSVEKRIIISAVDNDDAGNEGHERICTMFQDFEVKRFIFPDGIKDPCEMTQKQFVSSVYLL